MQTAYRLHVAHYPAVLAFLDALIPGQIFSTYDLVQIIRGEQEVDAHTPVQKSTNASIGRGIKAVIDQMNLVQHKKNHRLKIGGRQTSCSLWRKR